jgi:hypothetical protein
MSNLFIDPSVHRTSQCLRGSSRIDARTSGRRPMMASETEPITCRTCIMDRDSRLILRSSQRRSGRAFRWAATKQQRFRFVHQRGDFDRMLLFSQVHVASLSSQLLAIHRTVSDRLVSANASLVWISSVVGVFVTRSTHGTRTIRRILRSFCDCSRTLMIVFPSSNDAERPRAISLAEVVRNGASIIAQ